MAEGVQHCSTVVMPGRVSKRGREIRARTLKPARLYDVLTQVQAWWHPADVAAVGAS